MDPAQQRMASETAVKTTSCDEDAMLERKNDEDCNCARAENELGIAGEKLQARRKQKKPAVAVVVKLSEESFLLALDDGVLQLPAEIEVQLQLSTRIYLQPMLIESRELVFGHWFRDVSSVSRPRKRDTIRILPSERSLLALKKEKWSFAGIGDFRVLQDQDCFCGSEETPLMNADTVKKYFLGEKERGLRTLNHELVAQRRALAMMGARPSVDILHLEEKHLSPQFLQSKFGIGSRVRSIAPVNSGKLSTFAAPFGAIASIDIDEIAGYGWSLHASISLDALPTTKACGPYILASNISFEKGRVEAILCPGELVLMPNETCVPSGANTVRGWCDKLVPRNAMFCPYVFGPGSHVYCDNPLMPSRCKPAGTVIRLRRDRETRKLRALILMDANNELQWISTGDITSSKSGASPEINMTPLALWPGMHMKASEWLTQLHAEPVASICETWPKLIRREGGQSVNSNGGIVALTKLAECVRSGEYERDHLPNCSEWICANERYGDYVNKLLRETKSLPGSVLGGLAVIVSEGLEESKSQALRTNGLFSVIDALRRRDLWPFTVPSSVIALAHECISSSVRFAWILQHLNPIHVAGRMSPTGPTLLTRVVASESSAQIPRHILHRVLGILRGDTKLYDDEIGDAVKQRDARRLDLLLRRRKFDDESKPCKDAVDERTAQSWLIEAIEGRSAQVVACVVCTGGILPNADTIRVCVDTNTATRGDFDWTKISLNTLRELICRIPRLVATGKCLITVLETREWSLSLAVFAELQDRELPCVNLTSLVHILDDCDEGAKFLEQWLLRAKKNCDDKVSGSLGIDRKEEKRLKYTSAACEAMRQQKFGLFKILVHASRNTLQEKGPDGDTPIHVAFRNKSCQDQEVACALLLSTSQRINLDAKDKRGKKVRELCCPTVRTRIENSNQSLKKKGSTARRRKRKITGSTENLVKDTDVTNTANDSKSQSADHPVTVDAPLAKENEQIDSNVLGVSEISCLVAQAKERVKQGVDDSDDDIEEHDIDEDVEKVQEQANAEASLVTENGEDDVDVEVVPNGSISRLQERLRPVEEKMSSSDEDTDEEFLLEKSLLEGAEGFDGFLWEVELSEAVLGWLKKYRKKRPFLVRQMLRRMETLARGVWNLKNQKKVKGAGDVDLYEAKLTKGARILWELAVAFSERRSSQNAAVYAQTIRVWKIVLDHDNLSREIEHVAIAHRRGRGCHLRKELQGLEGRIADSCGNGNNCNIRSPRTFAAADVIVDGGRRLRAVETASCYPPASPIANRYTLMKFYELSSGVATAIRSDESRDINAHFKVTDTEHEIITHRPVDGSRISTLLVGRSGTGKTSCLLLRMFNEFTSYWKKAEHAGPLYSSNNGKGESLRHLRQMFITKSSPLRAEIERVFADLVSSKLAPEVASMAGFNDTRVQRGAVCVDRLSQVPDERFPVFLTSAEFLQSFDASLDGRQFLASEQTFRRETREQGTLSSLAVYFEEDDDQNDQGQRVADTDAKLNLDDDGFCMTGQASIGEQKSDGKSPSFSNSEVTYAVFLKLWPKLNSKTNVTLAPALVWTEIKSFITGSLEAMRSPIGYLSRDEYLRIGRKRSTLSEPQRSDVYALFARYLEEKKRRQLWDLGDFVFSLWTRLDRYVEKRRRLPVVIDAIFGDEIQDFTQAEIALLIRLSDPRELFLCGDSAQTIARGVGFRFCDLRLLWKELMAPPPILPVTKKLVNNYRSHKGCLALAAAVIDLVYRYFPDNIDKLPPDIGVLEGPKPILVQTRDVEDLLLLLIGNVRSTAASIDFGAHQVVLVRNEEARQNLPDELRFAMVLTIYESKGLEFDDVLIYNFFHDSSAKNWRVFATTALDDEDDATTKEVKALNAETHKILESELKLLYTAITRARVNVWIYDESKEREHMFKLFQKRNLVKVVTSVSGSAVDAGFECFARSTTNSEWIARGLEVWRAAEAGDEPKIQKSMFKVASTCFERGGAPKRAGRADALALIFEAIELKHEEKRQTSKQRQSRQTYKQQQSARPKMNVFRAAAHKCLLNRLYEEAAFCLCNCSEFALAAELYEEIAKSKLKQSGETNDVALRSVGLKQLRQAAKNFDRAKQYLDAARCFEFCGSIQECLQLLNQHGYYLRAIELQEKRTVMKSEELERLLNRAARKYQRDGRRELCLKALSRLPESTQLEFFAGQPGYLEERVHILRKSGNYKQAFDVCLSERNFKLAANCIESDGCTGEDLERMRLRLAETFIDENDDLSRSRPFELERVDAELSELVSSVCEIHVKSRAIDLLARVRGCTNSMLKAIEYYGKCNRISASMRTLRIASCALHLCRRQNVRELKGKVNLQDVCDALQGIAKSLKNDGLRDQDSAILQYFGFNIVPDFEHLEFASLDSRARQLVHGVTMPSPGSAAHERVLGEKVLLLAAAEIASLCILLSQYTAPIRKASVILPQLANSVASDLEDIMAAIPVYQLVSKCATLASDLRPQTFHRLQPQEIDYVLDASARAKRNLSDATKRLRGIVDGRWIMFPQSNVVSAQVDSNLKVWEETIREGMKKFVSVQYRGVLDQQLQAFYARVANLKYNRPNLDDYLGMIQAMYLSSRSKQRELRSRPGHFIFEGPAYAHRTFLSRALAAHAKKNAESPELINFAGDVDDFQNGREPIHVVTLLSDGLQLMHCGKGKRSAMDSITQACQKLVAFSRENKIAASKMSLAYLLSLQATVTIATLAAASSDHSCILSKKSVAVFLNNPVLPKAVSVRFQIRRVTERSESDSAKHDLVKALNEAMTCLVSRIDCDHLLADVFLSIVFNSRLFESTTDGVEILKGSLTNLKASSVSEVRTSYRSHHAHFVQISLSERVYDGGAIEPKLEEEQIEEYDDAEESRCRIRIQASIRRWMVRSRIRKVELLMTSKSLTSFEEIERAIRSACRAQSAAFENIRSKVQRCSRWKSRATTVVGETCAICKLNKGMPHIKEVHLNSALEFLKYAEVFRRAVPLMAEYTIWTKFLRKAHLEQLFHAEVQETIKQKQITTESHLQSMNVLWHAAGKETCDWTCHLQVEARLEDHKGYLEEIREWCQHVLSNSKRDIARDEPKEESVSWPEDDDVDEYRMVRRKKGRRYGSRKIMRDNVLKIPRHRLERKEPSKTQSRNGGQFESLARED